MTESPAETTSPAGGGPAQGAGLRNRCADVAVLVAFLALALLVTGFGITMPPDSVCATANADTWFHLWAFARTRLALAGGDAGYLTSHLVTFPMVIREPLALVDFLLPMATLPLQWLHVPLATVFNLTAAGGLCFSAVAGYFLAVSLGLRRSLGVVAGVIAGLNPFVVRQVAGGFVEYAWWGWLPLTFALFLRAVERGGRGRAAAYGVSLLVMLALSFYCAVFFFFLAAAWFLAAAVRPDGHRGARLAAQVRAHRTGLLFIVPLLLFWGHQQIVHGSIGSGSSSDCTRATLAGLPDARPYPVPQETPPAFRRVHGSVDLACLLRAAAPLSAGEHLAMETGSPFVVRFDTVYGLEWCAVALLAAAGFLVRARGRWTWLAISTGFGLLALGPVPVWNGAPLTHSPVLPYAWMCHSVPLLSLLVVPGRALLGSILCLAVLGAHGAGALTALVRSAPVRIRPAFLDVLVAAMIFASFAAGARDCMPLPRTRVEVHPVYRRLAEDPEAAALLELPDRGNVPRRMHAQSVHGKPIFKGFSMKGQTAVPAVETNGLVRALQPGPDGARPDTVAVRAAGDLAAMGFSHLLLHADGYPDEPAFRSACDLATRCLGPPLSGSPDVAAWRIRRAEGAPGTIGLSPRP